MSKRLLLLLLAAAGCAPRWRPVEEFTPRRSIPAEQQRMLAADAAGLFAPPRSPERVSRSLSGYQQLISAELDNVEYLLGAARAAAWLARRDLDPAERARLGVEYAGAALRGDPRNAESHLLRAVCLGLYSREKSGGALDHVKQMADHARRAIALDPAFDHAGGHRFLCRLLAQAPEFPTSIGDAEAAVEQGRAAVRIAPEFPGNQLALAAAYQANDQPREAKAATQRVLELLGLQEWEDAATWRAEARRILGGEG